MAMTRTKYEAIKDELWSRLSESRWKGYSMKEFIAQVDEFRERNGNGKKKMTATALAKLANISPAVVSQFLGGKYEGDQEGVRVNLECAMHRYEDRKQYELPNEYVPTMQGQVVERAMMYAIKQKQSSIILAESGCGKTTAAQHVCVREWGVIYCLASCHCYTPTAFLHRLAGAVGLGTARQSTAWRLQDQLEDQLMDKEWAVVIDDAHFLVCPYKQSRSTALDCLLSLMEATRSPFVLLGVPELWQTIGSKMTGDWFAQLKSRIGMRQHLMTKDIRSDDVARVVHSMGATCSTTVLNALTDLAQQPGGYRAVEKAVRWATQVVDEKSKRITVEAMKKFLRASSIANVHVRGERPAPAAKEAETA